MDLLHSILLVVHIATGFTALSVGTAILVIRKGGRAHRIAGLIFFRTMVVVALSAFGLSALRPNGFLAMVGAFTLYQTLSGLRAVRNKALHPTWRDVAITALGGANAVAMLSSGQVVLLVFGGISAYLVIADIRTYSLRWRDKPVPRLLWLRRHIGHMMGAYIAAFTAFLVVNSGSSGLGLLVWLGPTAIGVPLMVLWTRKFLARPPVGAALVLVLASATAEAQPYVEGGRTRHRFAQSLFGVDVLHLSGAQTQGWGTDASGRWTSAPLPAAWATRALIGGTHFWGHALFHLAVPLVHAGGGGVRTGVETAVRIFPWRIQRDRVRPYAGFAFVPVLYRAEDGPELIRHRLPLTAGLVYARGTGLFQVGASYDAGGTGTYPAVDGTPWPVRTPRIWYALGFAWMIDTTIGAEPAWRSGRTRSLTDSLAAQGRLDDLTVSAGVSNTFMLDRGAVEAMPSRSVAHTISRVYPEFGVGYYLHRADVHFGLVYRRAVDRVEGYGDRHTITRRALTLEVIKAVGDHLGFVPFVGPAIGYERIAVEDIRQGAAYDESEWTGCRPGLTAGWDIRPDRLQGFTLRTALRWFPAIAIHQERGTYRVPDQLEVDFIQLVIIPRRW